MNRVAPFLGVVCLVAWFCLAGLPASLWARPTLPRIPGSLPPTVLYFEPLTPLVIKPQRPPQHPEHEERTTVSFVAFAKHFALELELNDIFAPGAETLWIDNGTVRKEAPQAIFYKGRVTGEPDSWVRVSIHHGVLGGMIRTKKDLYFIEPGKRFFAGSSPYSMVIYRLSDTVSDWEPGSCALELPAVQSAMERHGTTADDSLLAEYRALVTELQQTLGPAALASSSGTLLRVPLTAWRIFSCV